MRSNIKNIYQLRAYLQVQRILYLLLLMGYVKVLREALEKGGKATITAPEIFYDSDTDLYISTSQIPPMRDNIELKSGQTVSFNISTGEPVIPVTVPPSQKLKYTVYGVDVQLAIEPGIVLLNEDGYTMTDTTFTYNILPYDTANPESENTYKAIIADIDLFEIDENNNESWVEYLIGDNTKGEGTAIAVAGSHFDITKRYEAEVVLNRGSDVEIRGERVPLTIIKVESVTAEGATKITNVVGNQDIIHFVTPKGEVNDEVILSAIVNPNTQEIRDQIDWEGATEDPNNPLKATVPKNTTAKYIVKIKVADEVVKELRVWSIWASLSGGVVAPVLIPVTTATGLRGGTSISATFNSTAVISPAEIITDVDQPALESANTVNPPGGTNSCGAALSGGANRKWDMSRRIAIRTETTANNPALTLGCVDNTDNFPADPEIGNDDAGTGDEDNDPYNDSGTLTSIDTPTRSFQFQGGNVGDTYRSRLWFQEFARLQISNTWFVISDPLLWRVEFRFIKQQVTEILWGIDVNGDGDMNDNVTEAMLGVDTNGDGDQNDSVGFWDNNNSISANDNADAP